MHALHRILVTLFLICALCVSTAQASLLLSPLNGSFPAYIVVPLRASEIERFAAGELATYIDKMTGAGISVIREKQG